MLRAAGVPASITEFLALLESLAAGVIEGALATVPSDGLSAVDQFYYLARSILVKDERHFDRFDRAFAVHFRGAERAFEALLAEVPADWLRQSLALHLSDEEKARIESLGGWEALMKALRERLEEQKAR